MFTEEEISCQRKKYFVKEGNFVSNATITREFELKFPVSHVRCQKFPVGNTPTPTGKMTPCLTLKGCVVGLEPENFLKKLVNIQFYGIGPDFGAHLSPVLH